VCALQGSRPYRPFPQERRALQTSRRRIRPHKKTHTTRLYIACVHTARLMAVQALSQSKMSPTNMQEKDPSTQNRVQAGADDGVFLDSGERYSLWTVDGWLMMGSFYTVEKDVPLWIVDGWLPRLCGICGCSWPLC